MDGASPLSVVVSECGDAVLASAAAGHDPATPPDASSAGATTPNSASAVAMLMRGRGLGGVGEGNEGRRAGRAAALRGVRAQQNGEEDGSRDGERFGDSPHPSAGLKTFSSIYNYPKPP